MVIQVLRVWTLVICAFICLGLGCGRATNEEAKKKEAEATQVAHQMQVKREARQKELRAMNVAQLARELVSESERGLEPFNSMAFTELTKRGEAVGLELKDSLQQPDRSSFLGLLALRKASPAQYAVLSPGFRVSVLVDALRTSKYFNAWGFPHAYWEDAAKALIAEGAAAEKPLIDLLQDKRDAPVWGSEEIEQYREYHYRVCDYAWAILNAIRNRKLEIPKNPEDRDRLIAKFFHDRGAQPR